MQTDVVNTYTGVVKDYDDSSIKDNNNQIIDTDKDKPPTIIRLNTYQMHRCVSKHLGDTQAKVFVSSLLVILTNMGLAKAVGKERYNKEGGSLSSKTCSVYEILLEEDCITTKLFKDCENS